MLLAAAEARIVFHRTVPSDLSSDAVLITYSRFRVEPVHHRQLVLCAAENLWNHYGKEPSLPPSPLARVPLASLGARPSARLQDPLILPYASASVPAAVEIRRDTAPGAAASIVSGADLVASAFFWISRYEESLIAERDEFGRVPQDRLCAVQEEITDRPLVDEYAELLLAWLEMLDVRIRSRRSPFRALLSHDVDSGIGVNGFRENAANGLRTFYREAVRGRRPWTAVVGLGHWTLRALGLRDEASVFRDIGRLDAEFGFPSFFFLMANGTHPEDAPYDILSEASLKVIEAIREGGGGIGLHVGLNAHRTFDQFRSEWERLRKAAPDALPVSRSHFLTFLTPATWRQLVELGIRIDSTLGFSHDAGFRSGTCHGFRPFDVAAREVLPIWELPMILMDVNLFYRPEAVAGIRRVRDLVGRVRAHGGCFVVNWHNVSYVGRFRSTYRSILGDLRDAQPVRLDQLPAEDGSLVW